MRISIEEVRRIARLAHLGLDPGGEERLRADLDQILAYVDNLNELDTTGIPEAAGPAGPGAPMRDDAAGSPLAPEAALANAPETGRGHFKVPRVLPG